MASLLSRARLDLLFLPKVDDFPGCLIQSSQGVVPVVLHHCLKFVRYFAVFCECVGVFAQITIILVAKGIDCVLLVRSVVGLRVNPAEFLLYHQIWLIGVSLLD